MYPLVTFPHVRNVARVSGQESDRERGVPTESSGLNLHYHTKLLGMVLLSNRFGHSVSDFLDVLCQEFLTANIFFD